MASLNDIRSTFLDFFERNGHHVVESSSLIPRNDPTLMFTNSGMVQFKNLFTGIETRDYKRAVTSQKCVRAGGKHNDLDNVGYTARHHTFFEMLGNFSFGDYFKETAIPMAWELLTKDFGINRDRLLVTVYHTDDEAAKLWKKVANLPDERIIRIATNDNFWMMGPTGPCGPCTEIFYDHGDHIPGGPPGSHDEGGDRFIEIWNNVFMQFELLEDGGCRDLEAKSIDTGMGLERIGALLQGKHDNYDTDLMRNLIEASAHVTNSEPDGKNSVHHRIIADHLRSTGFLIADGVMPSNEGRGYVLRRIMRRAMRHAHILGAQDPMMHQLVPALVRQMGGAYPELQHAQLLITEIFQLEEKKFRQALERGLRLLDDELKRLPEGSPLPGSIAFRLYDTYGFPIDLTQDALREKGRLVDTEGFNEAMAEQRIKARAAWSGSGEIKDSKIWFEIAEKEGATEFLGYDTETAEGVLEAIVQGSDLVDYAETGEKVVIALNQTPFYAESGGQIGDAGILETETGFAEIYDTRKTAGVFTHMAKVVKGRISLNQTARLNVNHKRRDAIRSNHSATHLLHEALRQEIGQHVTQKGSLNASDRLRFDFSHNSVLSSEQLEKVEDKVNAFIRQNSLVETRIMSPDDARELGAQALFGEKYGDEVRVVSMGRQEASGKGILGDTYSLELCGGTHVQRTGDIGVFSILSESASSAGVRRIEALTGQMALDYFKHQAARLNEISAVVKAPTGELVDRIKNIIEERRNTQNEVSYLRRELAMAKGNTTENSQHISQKEISGANLVIRVLQGISGKDLPSLVDDIKKDLKSAVVLLIADPGENGGKPAVAVGVTTDLTSKISAVDIVRPVAMALGGKGGGGRPDLAQAGGVDISKASEAVTAAEMAIRSKL